MRQLNIMEIGRQNYGGWDGRAINRHNERTYRAGGKVFALDKNLDCWPPSFELIEIPPTTGLCKVIACDIQDGSTWQEAEKIAFSVLRERLKLNG